MKTVGTITMSYRSTSVSILRVCATSPTANLTVLLGFSGSTSRHLQHHRGLKKLTVDLQTYLVVNPEFPNVSSSSSRLYTTKLRRSMHHTTTGPLILYSMDHGSMQSTPAPQVNVPFPYYSPASSSSSNNLLPTRLPLPSPYLSKTQASSSNMTVAAQTNPKLRW